jgi:hypothetical protein
MATDYRRFFENIPTCPYCETELSVCEAPPVHVGDGLGWGSEVLYICLNDECKVFVNGWKQIEEQFGHNSSYRYMRIPGSNESNVMMVGTADAFKGSIIDLAEMESQNKRFQEEKAAVAQFDTAVADKNMAPLLRVLLDEAATLASRQRAVVLLKELNDIACVDAIRNHTFRNTGLGMEANNAASHVLERNFKKECPHCAEIIKARAMVCMHCKRDLA